MSFKKTLQANQCCLYVIDAQERLMAHIHESRRVINNIDLMIRLADTLEFPIIANTQYKQGIGPIVEELVPLLADWPCIDKTEFNGLENAGVRCMLDKLPTTVDTLLLCGVESHICVYQTAMGAMRAGYKVRVIADAISSRTPENDAYAKERLRDIGVVVVPAEMIIYELLQKAGTPAFKAMLPYLK
ncbi:isochorismatase family protein [Candidatus Electrothrix sp.]|uniref:isochorismatase family protein n=1 Tax=Candidatus Electrothrix sp. TaxID=2170559 RepID=UPI004055C64D